MPSATHGTFAASLRSSSKEVGCCQGKLMNIGGGRVEGTSAIGALCLANLPIGSSQSTKKVRLCNGQAEEIVLVSQKPRAARGKIITPSF
jgi:hypothetical protein